MPFTALAQSLQSLDAPAPPPLPPAPLLESWLFESPTLPAIAAVGLGIVLYAALSTRGRITSARISAAIGALLAVAVIVTAWLVQTDREIVKQLTRDMVQSVVAADTVTLGRLLSTDAVLVSPLSGNPLDRAQILVRVAEEFPPSRQYHIRDYRIDTIDATMDAPNRGRVQLKVTVTPEEAPAPTPSWWRVDCERADDGQWHVSGIAMLSIGGIGAAGFR